MPCPALPAQITVAPLVTRAFWLPAGLPLKCRVWEAFSARGHVWPVSGYLCGIRDTWGWELTVSLTHIAGREISLSGLGLRAIGPRAGPLSASGPDRGTPRMRTRRQTAPSMLPDVFQRGERRLVQRAALVSSNKGSLGEVGACGIDGA